MSAWNEDLKRFRFLIQGISHQKLTKSGNELNQSDHVGGKVLVDLDLCGVEDGDGVEDDDVDAGPLLEEHGQQAEEERIPDGLVPQVLQE